MKIAYCCNNFFSYSETFIRDLALGLKDRNHAVSVFADEVTNLGRNFGQKLDGLNDLKISGVPIGVSLMARAVRATGLTTDEFLGRWRERRYAKCTYQKIKDFAPDIIYVDYGPKGILLEEISQTLNVPLVVHFHGYDLSSALASAWYRKRLCSLVHSASAIVVPSHHLRRLLTLASGIRSNIHVVPCEPDLADLAKLGQTVRFPVPTVVALGRLTGKKNPIALIEAFSLVRQKMPTARLELIGEGPERGRVEERIAGLNLEDAVTIHGAMEHEQALAILARGWVFAQHSVTAVDGDQEGLPVSILESLAMGVPVVSTIHSGIPEAIKDGVNGYLVREHDFETMAERIIGVLNGELQLDPRRGDWTRSIPLKRRVEVIERILIEAREVRHEHSPPGMRNTPLSERAFR